MNDHPEEEDQLVRLAVTAGLTLIVFIAVAALIWWAMPHIMVRPGG